MPKQKSHCPICEGEPADEIWPFCSVECLHADPHSAKDPTFRRRLAQFAARNSGARGPGGMVPTYVGEQLRWYLGGAQDEATIARTHTGLEAEVEAVVDGANKLAADLASADREAPWIVWPQETRGPEAFSELFASGALVCMRRGDNQVVTYNYRDFRPQFIER